MFLLFRTTVSPVATHRKGMVCEKGIQILLTIVGAFASFGLMTVAIGTDYWLYSRALICNSTANVTQDDPHNKDKKDPGALTHSGLWRICCLEGLSNIIGVIVYISAALGDISPKKDEDKKWQYSYGWSFYFGGLSFILAEMVGVLAVNIYIEKNKELRCRSRTDIFKSTTHAVLRLPSYRFRRRSSRSSSRSTEPSRGSRDPSPAAGGPPGSKSFGLPPSALLSQGPVSVSTLPNPHSHSRSHSALPGGDISLYTLSGDPKLGALGALGAPPMYGTVDRATLYQLHNCFPKESGGGGATMMMSGTLPSLKSHNPAGVPNASSGNSAPLSQPPPFSSSTVERERGMGTLDRLAKPESNSNTLNRKTTPV
ncbi:hypothetical protein QTP86_004904 [Hemibagrus guttatus]|nr:hypothetical protein QTP86_004904 [Hemibagrus guttatus]